MIRTALTTLAAAAVLTASAGAALLAGSGSALAPEPAQLTGDSYLFGSNGTTAAAVFVDTAVDTTIVKWPGTYSYNANLPAGTPCSPYDIGPFGVTGRVIVAYGGYKKCV